MNNLSRKCPVIAICGATGTGKSKLAIDLARRLAGEVINADAVQLYRGLDIATNKVTQEEAKDVVHHLLGCLDPVEGFCYNVHHYRRDCCRLIDALRARGVTPVVVGGTHYYLEAVLWLDFLRPTDERNFKEEVKAGESDGLVNYTVPPRARLPEDPKDYYAALSNANPEAAMRLHPNDTRKLQQALLIHLSRETTNASTTGALSSRMSTNRSSCPRYPPPDSLIFWLYCQPSVLKPSLDERVIKMVQRGLIRELDEFLVAAAKSLLPNGPVVNEDGTVNEMAKKALFQLANKGLLPSVGTEHWCRGVLQSIGFKEFEDFLQLSPPKRDSPTGEMVLNEAIKKMKAATRHYARRQVCLFFIPNWSSRRAQDTEPFVEPSSADASEVPPPPYICAACKGRVFVNPLQWKEHLNSRSHKKRVATLKKQTV
ncbi:tRNA dimethylallyltransferase [Echinococcus granulosus]|uniref:tRNA dimethylallyltransferase n=1 Tax=Echinococcus granulosus TaxID=6210 RepID=W6VC07_ECHGR|nr:tRNA dimethylallyltransferase [Echinococcus granulosus]EUB64389.1 tRNA dimethylallyltransferase [Echinococcus granulosus]